MESACTYTHIYLRIPQSYWYNSPSPFLEALSTAAHVAEAAVVVTHLAKQAGDNRVGNPGRQPDDEEIERLREDCRQRLEDKDRQIEELRKDKDRQIEELREDKDRQIEELRKDKQATEEAYKALHQKLRRLEMKADFDRINKEQNISHLQESLKFYDSEAEYYKTKLNAKSAEKISWNWSC